MKSTKAKKHRELRRLIVLILLFTIPAAGILLARAHFMNLPTPVPATFPQIAGATANEATPLINITKPNPVLPHTWGEDITNQNLPASDFAWLQVMTKSGIYLGELSNETFDNFQLLPANASNIHLFSNKSIIYSSRNNDLDVVVGIAKSATTTLFTAGRNQNISSTYFEPTTKALYVSTKNGRDSQVIVQKPNNETLPIYTTSQYQISITSVNVSKNILEFSDPTSSDCYQLNLISKTVTIAKYVATSEFQLPDDTPPLFPYELITAMQLKNGKLIVIATDPNQDQIVVTNTADGWQPIIIPECGNSCSYQFMK